MKSERVNGSKWICWLGMTDCRKQCVWRAELKGTEKLGAVKEAWPDRERRGDGKMESEVGWMNAVLTVTLLASAGVAQAQETQSQEAQEGPPLPTLTIHGETVGGEPGPVMIQSGAVGEAGTVAVGEGGAFFENHIELLGFGGGLHGGKVVKGAPFSAVATSETTQTSPGGEIGNEKPITIVSERWYSADMQMDVKSTHSDPRFGNTSYTLTNIQRTEPAATLFAVPSDYTVEQGHRGKFVMRMAPPPPPDN